MRRRRATPRNRQVERVRRFAGSGGRPLVVPRPRRSRPLSRRFHSSGRTSVIRVPGRGPWHSWPRKKANPSAAVPGAHLRHAPPPPRRARCAGSSGRRVLPRQPPLRSRPRRRRAPGGARRQGRARQRFIGLSKNSAPRRSRGLTRRHVEMQSAAHGPCLDERPFLPQGCMQVGLHEALDPGSPLRSPDA